MRCEVSTKMEVIFLPDFGQNASGPCEAKQCNVAYQVPDMCLSSGAPRLHAQSLWK